jgi:hypothetical protein
MRATPSTEGDWNSRTETRAMLAFLRGRSIALAQREKRR